MCAPVVYAQHRKLPRVVDESALLRSWKPDRQRLCRASKSVCCPCTSSCIVHIMERSGSEETSGSGAFVCSTSKDTFTERESLAEHYRSDLHRYNLKRKVAGL